MTSPAAPSLPLAQLLDWLEAHAPLDLAEDWDNVGLLLGDRARSIQRVLTCLTITESVVEEAVRDRFDLIVSHHPVLFRPVQRLTTQTQEGRRLLRLLAANVAVFSAHTAYDSAARGVNQQLAERLGLQGIEPLVLAKRVQTKIITFVPEQHLHGVREAMWAAGGGCIGDYDRCSFFSPGVGTFRGSEHTHPAIGQPGQFEEVNEIRLEVVCERRKLSPVLRALRDAHPYEEPAIDVVALDQIEVHGSGRGRFGQLPEPEPMPRFLERVARMLNLPAVTWTGSPDRLVERVAIGCGSAGEFYKDALRRSCDTLLSGEARFHTVLDAESAGIRLVQAGHYATERFAMETLASELANVFPTLTVVASTEERDPLQTFVVDDAPSSAAD